MLWFCLSDRVCLAVCVFCTLCVHGIRGDGVACVACVACVEYRRPEISRGPKGDKASMIPSSITKPKYVHHVRHKHLFFTRNFTIVCHGMLVSPMFCHSHRISAKILRLKKNLRRGCRSMFGPYWPLFRAADFAPQQMRRRLVHEKMMIMAGGCGTLLSWWLCACETRRRVFPKVLHSMFS